MTFRDRSDAGRRLAERLRHLVNADPVVVALPRGGVPVGYEIARELGAPLDVKIVRKLGAPGQEELGIGAVVDGDHPQAVLNEDILDALAVSRDYLEGEAARQLSEIRRRQERYRHGRDAVPLVGRTVIVVDDGIATGGSMRAALRGIRRSHPARLVLAVPVAPPDTLDALRDEVDELVYIDAPEPFGAVGRFYDDFTQTSDEEVEQLLEAADQAVADRSSRESS
jgi:putative phosphoribosyl transferase